MLQSVQLTLGAVLAFYQLFTVEDDLLVKLLGLFCDLLRDDIVRSPYLLLSCLTLRAARGSRPSEQNAEQPGQGA